MLITEYFKDNELACPCGCELMPDKRSVERLYAFRMIMNKPIPVNSAVRCPTYNKSVGGSENSAHLKGAYDIAIEPEDEWRAIQAAQSVGFNGIGIKNNVYMHLDDKHSKPTVWTYS